MDMERSKMPVPTRRNSIDVVSISKYHSQNDGKLQLSHPNFSYKGELSLRSLDLSLWTADRGIMHIQERVLRLVKEVDELKHILISLWEEGRIYYSKNIPKSDKHLDTSKADAECAINDDSDDESVLSVLDDDSDLESDISANEDHALLKPESNQVVLVSEGSSQVHQGKRSRGSGSQYKNNTLTEKNMKYCLSELADDNQKQLNALAQIIQQAKAKLENPDMPKPLARSIIDSLPRQIWIQVSHHWYPLWEKFVDCVNMQQVLSLNETVQHIVFSITSDVYSLMFVLKHVPWHEVELDLASTMQLSKSFTLLDSAVGETKRISQKAPPSSRHRKRKHSKGKRKYKGKTKKRTASVVKCKPPKRRSFLHLSSETLNSIGPKIFASFMPSATSDSENIPSSRNGYGLFTSQNLREKLTDVLDDGYYVAAASMNKPRDLLRHYFHLESYRFSSPLEGMTRDQMCLRIASFGSDAKKSAKSALSTLKSEAHELTHFVEDEALKMYHLALSYGRERLLDYHELPHEWRNNQYILSGYRFIHIDRWDRLLKSMFEVHNETINIHSHMIPAIVVGYLGMVGLMRASLSTELSVQALFVSAALGCLVCSTVWHTFAGCAEGHWFSRCACVDYVGISALISATIIGVEFYAFYDKRALAYMYMGISGVLALAALYLPWKRWFNDNKKLRILFFISLSASGVLPVAHFTLNTGIMNAIEFLRPHMYSLLSYIIGLIFYAYNFPECVAPAGLCDKIGASHQFWHIAIVAGIYFQWRALTIWSDTFGHAAIM